MHEQHAPTCTAHEKLTSDKYLVSPCDLKYSGKSKEFGGRGLQTGENEHTYIHVRMIRTYSHWWKERGIWRQGRSVYNRRKRTYTCVRKCTPTDGRRVLQTWGIRHPNQNERHTLRMETSYVYHRTKIYFKIDMCLV